MSSRSSIQVLLMPIFCRILGTFLLLAPHTLAVTVYPTNGAPPTTTLAPGVPYSGPDAFNPVSLNVPAVPTQFPTKYNIQVANGATPTGASIPLLSSFFGFSIEMSVVDQVFGPSSQLINVPFLNLMANLVGRSGRVNIRVGGNTQETAIMVQNTTDGQLLEKDYQNTQGTTKSPAIDYKEDLLYILSNISHIVNVRWILGIPFNTTNPFRLDIVEKGQAILGDYLIGLQAGNEPDFYAKFHKRPANYTVMDYYTEVGQLINQMKNDPQIVNSSMLMGPSVASGMWSPETVWNTGFIQAYSPYLAYLSVEHYPADNCGAQFNVGNVEDSQTELPKYLTHDSVTRLVAPYINSTNIAQENGKPFVMLETNTASCGGFGGLSDAFAAALWATDHALQMAYANFSMAMFHTGGINVFYNPFTAPPLNQSSYNQWTIGPVYYAALVTAETIGNGSQIIDITDTADLNSQAPAYLIYENGNPSRIALFNYVTDPSGAHDIQFTFQIGQGESNKTPAQVSVKYLRASSVTQKGNFTWAGQTFGGVHQSDGRPMGQENVQTVPCNPAKSCTITVYAPSFALVFLDNNDVHAIDPTMTFSTSVFTKTLTVGASVLATSNGQGALHDFDHLGRTSKGLGFNMAISMTHALRASTILGRIFVAVIVFLGCIV